jgi:hypothetical protein
MSEALVFILKQFYFSLGSGCIFNFYILCAYYILKKAEIIPELFNYMEFSNSVFVVLFISSAVIFHMFIGGFTECGIRCYLENRDKFLKRNKKNNTEPQQGKSTNEYKNLNVIGKFLFFNFIKPTIAQACVHYWKKAAQNKLFLFMYDPDSGNIIDDEDDIVLLMQITALKISGKSDNSEFYRFRDMSFMAQILRSTLLLISLISLVCTIICILIVDGSSYDWINIGWFNLICFIISSIFMLITTTITWAFSKRYVRDIGKWYNALDLHKKVTKTDRHAAGHDAVTST